MIFKLFTMRGGGGGFPGDYELEQKRDQFISLHWVQSVHPGYR